MLVFNIHHGLLPLPSCFRYLLVGPATVGGGCGKSSHSMLMKPSDTVALNPLFKGRPCSIATPFSSRSSLSSKGSPDAKVVMAVAMNLAFLSPRCFTSWTNFVFWLVLAPAATSDLPSAARVGLRRMVPIKDVNLPGMFALVSTAIQ
jgi:hypothetical protein